jgi:hypothetical protein
MPTKTSPSDEEAVLLQIMEEIASRAPSVDPELAGFVLEDMMYEFKVGPDVVLEAAERLVAWAGYQLGYQAAQQALARRTERTSAPPPKGYVYIFKNGTYFKLGSSTNVEQRLNAINRNIPPGHSHVTLWYKIEVPGFRDAEKYLHKHFEDKKVTGETGGVEWFAFTVDDLEWISKFLRHWDGECKFGLDF